MLVIALGVLPALVLLGAFVVSMFTEAVRVTVLTGGPLPIIGLCVLLAVFIALGVNLLRGALWAHRALLVLFLLASVAGLTMSLALLLGDKAQADSNLAWLGERAWAIATAMSLGIWVVFTALFGWLLIASSAPGSRLRYGTYASISVAAATAVVCAINVISTETYARRSMEVLGRYGLGKRTARHVSELDGVVNLTCVYTPPVEGSVGGGRAASALADDADQVAQWRRRTMELLEEFHECNPNIRVAGADSFAAKIKLLAQVRAKLEKGPDPDADIKAGRAWPFAVFLSAFTAVEQDIAKELKSHHQRLSALSREGTYLSLWGDTAALAFRLKSSSEQLEKVAQEVRAEFDGSTLPHYGRAHRKAGEVLDDIEGLVETTSKYVETLSGLPEAVKKNRPAVLKQLDNLQGEVETMRKTLGLPGEETPDDPAKALEVFAEAAQKVVAKLTEARKVISEVGGRDRADVVGSSRLWEVRGVSGTPRIVEVEGRLAIVSGTATLADVYDRMAEALDNQRMQVAALVKATNVEYQKTLLLRMRKDLQDFGGQLQQMRAHAVAAMDKLTKVEDPASKELFEQVAQGKLFADLLGKIASIRDGFDRAWDKAHPGDRPAASVLAGEDDEKSEDTERQDKIRETGYDLDSLASDITQENIVVIEAGGKVEVVGFDEVWPVIGSGGFGTDERRRRVFNGAKVITSRILSMTREPFATVYIAHVSSPQQAMRGGNPMPQDVGLGEVRKILKEANLDVRMWNVASQESPRAPAPGSGAEDAPSKDKGPYLLLVMPPAPAPMNPYAPRPASFGPLEKGRLRNVINTDDDCKGAVFLANYSSSWFGGPAGPYLDNYLAEDWGINVRNDYRLIMTAPDSDRPGRYKVLVLEFTWLPLSSFTDHAIGKPLQAQRMLWRDICPMVVVDEGAPEGVEVASVLTVPARRKTIWATRRVRELIRRIELQREGFVEPDFDSGDDLPVPLDVALAAERRANDETGVQASRIVALGMGNSFLDDYLGERVLELDPRGGVRFIDPPRADGELLVNCAFWILGREDYIASGPIRARPINVSAKARDILAGVFVVGVPAAVMCLGGLVMLVRRRS